MNTQQAPVKQNVDCHQFSKNRLIDILDSCLNKTLGEVDVSNVFKKTETNPKITGIAGMVSSNLFWDTLPIADRSLT